MIVRATLRTYPSQFGPPPTILAVLTKGEIQDLAVYVGVGTAEWVSRNGDKLSFAEACCHFPGLRELAPPWHYRP